MFIFKSPFSMVKSPCLLGWIVIFYDFPSTKSAGQPPGSLGPWVPGLIFVPQRLFQLGEAIPRSRLASLGWFFDEMTWHDMTWHESYPMLSNPIGSMYAIYGNIYHQDTPNVSIYTIHGSYGNIIFDWLNHWDSSKCLHHSYSLFITGILHWVVWSTHLMTYTRLHGTFRFSTLDLSLRRACAYIIIYIYICI